MTTVDKANEQDLEDAFRDSAEFGVEYLHEFYGKRVLRLIKRASHDLLTTADLMDAYQDTLLAVLAAARLPDFDPSRPMRLVARIARNKSIDQLRALGHRPVSNQDDLVAAVSDSLRDTEAGSRWNLFTPSERAEFQEAVLEEVALLPRRQRVVARCFLDCFAEVAARRSYQPLAQAVGGVTGEVETVVAVKSAWHDARQKIARGLATRGFNFLQVG